MFELNEHEAINTDYMINVYLKKHEMKWVVIGRMIDGTLLPLSEHLSEETGKVVYNKLLAQHNERSKVLPADVTTGCHSRHIVMGKGGTIP